MRKAADLDLEETVACTVQASEEVTGALADHVDELEEEGRVELTFGEVEDGRSWTITCEAIDLEENLRIQLGP